MRVFLLRNIDEEKQVIVYWYVLLSWLSFASILCWIKRGVYFVQRSLMARFLSRLPLIFAWNVVFSKWIEVFVFLSEKSVAHIDKLLIAIIKSVWFFQRCKKRPATLRIVLLARRCNWILGSDGEAKKFSVQDQQEIVSHVIEPMASEGMRTICIAYKDYVPSK